MSDTTADTNLIVSIRDTLGQFVDYIPVCPEVDCGLPVPREAMRLDGNVENLRLVTRKSGRDMTDMMLRWGREKLDLLEKEDLCGFIFRSKSPYSGMAQVRVCNDKGMSHINGVGIWAKIIMERFPLLPVEEDDGLHDLKVREVFIERIVVFKRWREEAADKGKIANLTGFNTRHKLLIMSHSPDIYRKMWRLTANTDGIGLDNLRHEYNTAIYQSHDPKNHNQEELERASAPAWLLQEKLTSDEK
jgi:uncharacterized protein YbbK (DUF523 family)